MAIGGYSPQARSVLRIVAGFLFAFHGAQKLLGWFGGVGGGGGTVPLFSLFGLAGILELIGGLLFLFGLFTRPVAFLLSGEMAVAYFMSHAPKGTWPILNAGELAVLYCFVFLYFVFADPGPWSLDAAMRKSAT